MGRKSIYRHPVEIEEWHAELAEARRKRQERKRLEKAVGKKIRQRLAKRFGA